MNHYLDIRLRPDPEFGQDQLMSALFSKLHRALVGLNSRDIGVSFPEVDKERPTLGGCLRLHGEELVLQRLMTMNWLSGMRDHSRVGEIQAVPSAVSYRTVKRVQAKSSPERIRRRQIRRHDLTEAEASARIPDAVAKKLALPFVSIRSQSTNRTFRLIIQHGECSDVHKAGVFSSYGLSGCATIPWF